jgi:hypothetical protein
MGQTVSKVANRVVGSSSTSSNGKSVVPKKHIPSIPGKTSADAAALGITSTTIVDPITGFTRGTAPLTPSEERQRQFLESRQNDFMKIQQQRPNEIHRHSRRNGNTNDSPITTTTPPTTSTPPGTDTKMPDDLLNFLKDMGPVIRSPPKQLPSTEDRQQRRVPRISRLIQPSSDLQKESDIDPEATETNMNEQKPGYDKTRITTNMRLATNIPGYETSRTTSFSTKLDVPDDPNDIPGYTMIQLYGVLSTEHSNEITSVDGIQNTDTNPKTEREQLLQNAYQYMRIPVLLKDTDGSYIGAHPNHVSSLLGAHRGMKLLDTTHQAKLVLQDLYEKELLATAATAALNETNETTNEITASNTGQPVAVVSRIDLGPSKAASASTSQ